MLLTRMVRAPHETKGCLYIRAAANGGKSPLPSNQMVRPRPSNARRFASRACTNSGCPCERFF
jgi:hypothetical protein